jgi:dihydroorotase
MAKLMALGFSLNQVVEMATINAARLLGRSHEMGFIRVGQPAEISVLRLEERDWKAIDSQKEIIQARQALIPVYAIRNETVYEPLSSERP